jgi:ribosome-associated heat shock protein Hsp15
VTDTHETKTAQIRIDKWLWYARQTKTRSLAQKLVTGGNARLNGDKVISPSKMIGPQDVLTLKIGLQVKVLKLLDCGTHRGSFSIAQLLYEDLSPIIPKAEILTKGQQGLPDPHGKPDSRERLLARRLSGKE